MFTKFGQTMAQEEPLPNIESTGAQAHMEACHYDAGILVKLTGTDFRGRPFHKHASSVYGAFATMQAVSGLNNAWLIRPGEGRKLLIRR